MSLAAQRVLLPDTADGPESAALSSKPRPFDANDKAHIALSGGPGGQRWSSRYPAYAIEPDNFSLPRRPNEPSFEWPYYHQTLRDRLKSGGCAMGAGLTDSNIDATDIGTPDLTTTPTTAQTSPYHGTPSDWMKYFLENAHQAPGTPNSGDKLQSLRELFPDLGPFPQPSTSFQGTTLDHRLGHPQEDNLADSGSKEEWEDVIQAAPSSRSPSESSWESESLEDASRSAGKSGVQASTCTNFPANINGSPIVQLGTAKLRVEVLSISGLVKWPLPTKDGKDACSDSGEFSGKEFQDNHGDNLEDTSGQNRSHASDRANSRVGTRSSDQTPRVTERGRRGRGRDSDEENENDNNRRKKRQRRSLSPGIPTAQSTPRFACPYQVFEASLDCFRRGSRNPKGGCEGIYRLKQHLHRRHVLSSRCQRCWVSFDKNSKLTAHVEQANCHEIPRPDNERFIETGHEILIEKTNGTAPEDTWWALFKTLIPGMHARSIESLQIEYLPYYVSSEFSWPLATLQPGLNLSSIPITFPDAMVHQADGLDQVPFNLEPHIIEVPLFGASLPNNGDASLSQQYIATSANDLNHLAAPYQTPSPNSTQSTYCSRCSSGTSVTSTNHTGPSENSTPDTTPTRHLPRISDGSVRGPGDGGTSTTQLRRSYQRLQARSQRAETTIAALRDTNRLIQRDVRRIDTRLEEIFALEQEEDLAIPPAIYERPAGISQILIDIGERLK